MRVEKCSQADICLPLLSLSYYYFFFFFQRNFLCVGVACNPARSLVGECVAIYSDDAPGMLMMMTTIVSCF